MALEFKLKHKGKKLHFINDFQPQQLPELYRAFTGCLYHKISDMGIGCKPCDSLQICNSPAYVGVMWYEPRKPKILYLVHIESIHDLVMKFETKSISEEEAKEMAKYTITL